MTHPTRTLILTKHGLAELLPVTPPEPALTDPWLRAKVERDWASVEEKVERLERHCRQMLEVA